MTVTKPLSGPPRIHRIHPVDNVATALADIQPGDVLDMDGRRIVARAAVPFGHKIALVDIAEGALVIKYGEPIGRAKHRINAGDYAHVHNIVTLRGIRTDTEA
jgi:altronate hydrolase